MQIQICKLCGCLHQGNDPNVCPKCVGVADDALLKIRDYLEDNPTAGISETSEATEISGKIILYLLKKGRISMVQSAIDALRCEKCNAPISSGRFCGKCSAEVGKALTKASGSAVGQQTGDTEAEKREKAAKSDPSRRKYAQRTYIHDDIKEKL